MFCSDSVAALVTPLWRNILICQGGVRGAALMKIDLSLPEQLVFLIRLCLQQGVGWVCVCEEGTSTFRTLFTPQTLKMRLRVQPWLRFDVLCRG